MLIRYNKIVDLSLKLRKNMAIYPGDPQIDIQPIKTIAKDNVNMLSVKLGTHNGTHMDAPRHHIQTGYSLDRFPPSYFVNKAMKIDLVPDIEGPYTACK